MKGKMAALWGRCMAVAVGCLLLVFLTGCNLHKAERTARQFLKAYYIDLDFDKAMELSTEDSHKGILYKKNMSALSPYAKDEAPKLTVFDVLIDPDNGDYAYCAYEVNGHPRMLPLQKHDGKWVVDTDEDSIEGDNSRMSASGVAQVGFATAASSTKLPQTGPGTREREKQKQNQEKTK